MHWLNKLKLNVTTLLLLDDLLMKLGQKQSKTPDCRNKMNLQPNFWGKCEKIKLNKSGWRYLIRKSKDVKVFKLADRRGNS